MTALLFESRFFWSQMTALSFGVKKVFIVHTIVNFHELSVPDEKSIKLHKNAITEEGRK